MSSDICLVDLILPTYSCSLHVLRMRSLSGLRVVAVGGERCTSDVKTKLKQLLQAGGGY